jgi:DNA helicase-2/ATP-dependent DNA helicase PcrA
MHALPESSVREIVHGLSAEQKVAVTSQEKYVRIVAAAGAGKTETLTRRVVFLLASGEQARSIVAFTFTERAAQEMKDRIYRRVEKILGPDPSKRLGEMYVGTIHSFAVRILQDRFGYGNYDVLDEHQEMAFLLRHGWRLGLGPNGKLPKTNSYSQNCSIFLRSVNVLNDELIDIDSLRERNPDFADEFQKYEGMLDENRLITFGRMIRLCVEELNKGYTLLDNIRHLIVDEYQDINKAQERLIEIIAQKASCMVVGDPRQCIYQWRGSDPGCFDRFGQRLPAQTIEISANRRSMRPIINVANRVADHFEDDSLRTAMSCSRSGSGTVHLLCHSTAADEASWIADQITVLKGQNICNYGDIAVLLRSVSTSAPVMIKALKERQIPYLVGGRVGLFKRDEVQAIGRLFAWFGDMWWQEDPYNWNSKLEGERLVESALRLWPNPIGKAKLSSFKKEILDGKFDNFTEAFQQLLVILGILEWEIGDESLDAMMANLGRFSSLLTDFETSRRRRGAKPDWKKDLESLVWFMNTYATEAYEEQMPEDVRGHSAVLVMTVHQAKGLEWPVVFLPSLTSRRFPSRNTGKAQKWYLSGRLFDKKRYEGSINDERRLFYVALTRARDALCLSYFERIQNAQSPSPFVEELGLEKTEPPVQPILSRLEPNLNGEEEIISYTISELIEYIRCHYFYRLRNIWGYQSGLVAEIGFGRSLHHILRLLGERAKGGEDPTGLLPALVQSDFHLPFANKGTLASLRSKAENLLNRYLERHSNDVLTAEEIEARLEFPLTKLATVSGRVDVIISKEGQRELRDYKTADDPRSSEEASVQLRLYALGLSEIGQPVAGASIANLVDNVLVPVSTTVEDLSQAKSIAESAIEGIFSQRFEGNPCQFCESCDYAKICHYRSKPSAAKLSSYAVRNRAPGAVISGR